MLGQVGTVVHDREAHNKALLVYTQLASMQIPSSPPQLFSMQAPWWQTTGRQRCCQPICWAQRRRTFP